MTAQPSYRTLHSDRHHCGWDNALPPALHLAPGDTIDCEVRDSSGGQFTPASTDADVPKRVRERMLPATGPIFIEGAAPGDALVVDLIDFVESGWGWTALIPGFGLLAADFPAPVLHHARYGPAGVDFEPGIVLPMRPFHGLIGVAPAEPGPHPALPPRATGGNMDVRDLTRDARLYLPVQVPGALFSIGDTHAAQGDGAVCGTAIESPMTVRLRFDLLKDAQLRRPRFDLPGSPTRHIDQRGYAVTTGIAPALMQAAQDAVRDMIDLLGREHHLAPDLAYLLCSVAVDLRISEIVDRPNWIVAAYLPKAIFV